MKDFKGKILFADLQIKSVTTTEKDKYLALASIDKLRSFLPDVDIEKEIDLVPIAFNACVVNRMNKNYDAITTATALDIYKSFIPKPINVEHNRNNVGGVILTAGFSEFGSDKPLKLEDIKDTKAPFYITLGGVIWRSVSEKLADFVIESNDPTSPYYLKVSASWELGFYDYIIAKLPKEGKNLEDAEYVEDEEEIQKLESSMKAYGGTGVVDEKTLCRVPKGKVKAFGVGLTETPAAEVQGIVVPESMTPKKIEATQVVDNNVITENISSQTNDLNVKKDSLTMKIKDVKDITDELLKTCTASEITEFISNQIKEANDQYVSEKTAAQEAANKIKADYENLVNENSGIKTKLTEVEKVIETLKQEAKAKELQEKFDIHMGLVSDKFELDEETSKLVASQIQGMDDESFAQYEKTLSVLLKGKEKKQTTSVASTPNTDSSPEAVVSNAIDNGKKETPNVPATPSNQPTLEDKWKSAFGEAGWVFSNNKRK